ncbi:lysoplasmalogenase isoform X2 [Genypterus blacodes]|uniref:lysoplasmalogenase isoform X2 n=1 Tax=Genypterus blacodes TaxID=154954 RepID=UPI003F774692
MDILETDAYDRKQRRNMSCALFVSLLPFFAATAAYFCLWTPDPSVMSAGVKAAPVLLLAAVVLSWNGGQSVLGVAGGLVFSAVGDCCLIWPGLFLHGMGAFALAHLLYSVSFLSPCYTTYSSSTWRRFMYLILFALGVSFYIYLFPYLQKAPDSAVMTPAVGIYVALIALMATLAFRTRQTATLLGSLSFMISDMLLAVQMFKVMELEHGTHMVMVSYYLAQLLIAVGDVNAMASKDDFGKWKRS